MPHSMLAWPASIPLRAGKNCPSHTIISGLYGETNTTPPAKHVAQAAYSSTDVLWFPACCCHHPRSHLQHVALCWVVALHGCSCQLLHELHHCSSITPEALTTYCHANQRHTLQRLGTEQPGGRRVVQRNTVQHGTTVCETWKQAGWMRLEWRYGDWAQVADSTTEGRLHHFMWESTRAVFTCRASAHQRVTHSR